MTERLDGAEPSEGTDPADVLGHLQAAARELIAAGRGILDVADEVFSDRIRLLSAIVGEPRARAAGAPPARSKPPKVEKIEVEKIEVERIEVERVDGDPPAPAAPATGDRK